MLELNFKKTLAIISIFILVIVLIIIYLTHKSYMQALVKEYDTITHMKKFENSIVEKVYSAKNKATSQTDIIQIAENQGYKSVIRIMVCINKESGKIDTVKMLEQHESEDYGRYIAENWFLDRFLNKSVDSPLKYEKMAAKAEDEVVIVTGATVSSKAVIDLVNSCMENYRKCIQEDYEQ